MRILSVTAQKPDSTGSGTYLTELVNGFRLLGHTQAVVAGINAKDTVSFPGDVLFFPVYYNTPKLPFPVLGMSDSMPYQSTRYQDLTPAMMAQFETAFTKELDYAVTGFRPDIILCHHLYLLTAILRERFPEQKIYAISHGTDLRQLQQHNLYNDRITRNIANLDRIFALHQTQKEDIASLYPVDTDKITVIGSGYNRHIFFDRRLPKNSSIKKIIYAGKICEKKGILSLLNSLSLVYPRYPHFELHLAGGYSDETEYRKICAAAEKAEFEVRFLGKLNQQELANRFNEADLFVLPSFFEGLPLVIIEALACGLDVIATDLPGVSRWISDHISEHAVTFIAPPAIKNVDEPDETTLPLFEQRLSDSIYETFVNTKASLRPDTQNVTWMEICKKIVNSL